MRQPIKKPKVYYDFILHHPKMRMLCFDQRQIMEYKSLREAKAAAYDILSTMVEPGWHAQIVKITKEPLEDLSCDNSP